MNYEKADLPDPLIRANIRDFGLPSGRDPNIYNIPNISPEEKKRRQREFKIIDKYHDVAKKSKRNNLMIAAGPSAITPGMFTPPPFRYLDHIKIPSIKEAEMRHFKRFIESTGGTWNLSKNKKRSSMKLASGDSSMMNYVTEKGYFLDGKGNAYSQTGGKFSDPVEYNVDVHGLPVPLAQNKKKQRSKLQIA